ncbi:MAG TPA: NYN domain-containing protein [Urbifossiella sp.]|nr:NYN domain-containing protein [Urbifossiella sp.]
MKATPSDGERSLAVFIDFENMGLGFNNRRDRFEIAKVLERLVEKGKIVAKKAYADWSRFGMYTGALHEAAIELVEIPRRGMSGKNSADIRLVVDAIDLAYSKDHIDTFVIVSGDSDFSPLVSKLKELGKHVIGLGLADATSDLLRDNCDEFIYYEDLDRAPIIPVAGNEQIPEKKRKVFALLLDSLLALRRENKDVLFSSMVKDTMKRKKPSFNEDYYGYRTFSELLEDAQKEGLLEIEKHRTSGMYVVSRFGLEMQGGVATGPAKPATPERKEQRPAARDSGRTQQPPERGRGRAPASPAVLPMKPMPEPSEPAADERRPLGRELVDEAGDDLDVIPSYGPKKGVPPARRPAPAKPAPKPAAKPEEPKRGRGRNTPAPAPASRRKSPDQPPPRQPPPPAPRLVTDDDDFGAGLE